MKKFAKLLLMLAVTGVAMSCEKEVIDRTKENEANRETNVVEKGDAAEMAKFVGCWEYISVAD